MLIAALLVFPVQAEPDKAARWRTDEVEAAHGVEALLAACEGDMDTAGAEAPAGGGAVTGGGDAEMC